MVRNRPTTCSALRWRPAVAESFPRGLLVALGLSDSVRLIEAAAILPQGCLVPVLLVGIYVYGVILLGPVVLLGTVVTGVAIVGLRHFGAGQGRNFMLKM